MITLLVEPSNTDLHPAHTVAIQMARLYRTVCILDLDFEGHELDSWLVPQRPARFFGECVILSAGSEKAPTLQEMIVQCDHIGVLPVSIIHTTIQGWDRQEQLERLYHVDLTGNCGIIQRRIQALLESLRMDGYDCVIIDLYNTPTWLARPNFGNGRLNTGIGEKHESS